MGEGRLPRIRGQAGEIDPDELDGPRNADHLHRLLARLVEGRAERLVARDDRVQRAPERLDVEVAVEAEGLRHVVGGRARADPVEQPELRWAKDREGGRTAALIRRPPRSPSARERRGRACR